jgi:hypothetical protein
VTQRTGLTLFGLSAGLLALGGLALPNGLSLAVTALLPIVVASVVALQRLDRDGGLRLVGTFLLALSLRWVVAALIEGVIYSSPDYRGLFAPDEMQYDYLGQLYADFLQGRAPDPLADAVSHNAAIVPVIGVAYYVFGYVPFLPKMLNGLLGSWSAALTALIAARVFPTAVARRAGLLTALVPSLILWSSLITKDTTTLVGVQLGLLGFVRGRLDGRSAALVAAGLALILPNRAYEAIFLVMPMVASLLLIDRRHLARNGALLFVLVAVALVVIQRTRALDAVSGGADLSTVERLNEIRTSYATGAGSAIDISIVDTSTVGGLALWMPIGLVYFFLAPLPFSGTSITSLATSPEMLIWYSFLPAAWRGLRAAWREGGREVRVLVFYAAFSSIGWAMVVTNVGTIYRYRAQVLFVPILFIALDQVRRRAQKRPRRKAFGAPTPALAPLHHHGRP